MTLEHRFAHIPQDARRGRAWLSSLSPLFEGRLADGAVVPPTAFSRYHHLGEIVLAADESPAQVIERSARIAAAQALDHIVLRVHVGGTAQITSGQRIGEAAAGDLVVLDLAQEVRIAMPQLTTATVVVPRRLLPDQACKLADWHGRILAGTDDSLAGLLAGHLSHLTKCLVPATPAQMAHLIAATLALCQAFGSAAPVSDVAKADAGPMRNVILRFIEVHLTKVDVQRLTAEFGLSRRTLYRLFADVGGVQAYIRDRRLARAMQQLSRTPADRRAKIASLSYESGFRNEQTFSRAFKRRYGLNPSDVVAGPPTVAPMTAEPALLGWLRDL